MTDSSARRPDGTAGRVIGARALNELRSYISQLRELGRAATAPARQVHVGPRPWWGGEGSYVVCVAYEADELQEVCPLRVCGGSVIQWTGAGTDGQ